MLDTTKLYSFIPVWMTLMFTQGDRVTAKLELVHSFCWKVAWSNSNVYDSWLCKQDDCEQVLYGEYGRLSFCIRYTDRLCVQFCLCHSVQAGPMVPGVPPREASERLLIAQNNFDTLYRKYVTYTGGEELFGLEVSEYPELLKIKKELTLLQKLYGLYNNVIDAVRGYYDIFWVEVDIDKITAELQDFQNRYLHGAVMWSS